MSEQMFTQEQLERFRIHNAKRMKIAHKHSITQPTGTNSHQRGYIHGDLRCCHCLKWLNPNKPEEAKEILYAKGNTHPRHKNCPVRSAYTACLSMRPKCHVTRRKMNNEAKRY